MGSLRFGFTGLCYKTSTQKLALLDRRRGKKLEVWLQVQVTEVWNTVFCGGAILGCKKMGGTRFQFW